MSKAKKAKPEIIGYVVFTVGSGIINDFVFRLYDAEAAKKQALKIIKDYRKEDSYADERKEDYEEMQSAVECLDSTSLDEDTELIIREIISDSPSEKKK